MDTRDRFLRVVPNRFEFDLWVMDMPQWWYQALLVQMALYRNTEWFFPNK